MGIFDRFSVKRMVLSLHESTLQLRLAVFGLLVEKYAAEFGNDEAGRLAVGVMNHALLEQPTREALEYARHHQNRIRKRAQELWSDALISEAIAYIYASLIMQASFVERAPITNRGTELANRATQLSLHVPNTYEICGTADAKDCIPAIAEYARELAEKVASRR